MGFNSGFKGLSILTLPDVQIVSQSLTKFFVFLWNLKVHYLIHKLLQSARSRAISVRIILILFHRLHLVLPCGIFASHFRPKRLPLLVSSVVYVLFFSSWLKLQSSLCDLCVFRIFIHLAVCLTTGPKPLPKRALHIVRSRASSLKW